MKFLTFFYQMMAVLLIMGLASCSSAEEEVDENPGVSDQRLVKTRLILNVSPGNTASTRMSLDNTQATNEMATFRGIDQAWLLGYKMANNGQHIVTATEPSTVYNLGNVIAAGQITTADSRYVTEFDMEVDTNTLLFYGKAPKTGTDKEQGKTLFHIGEGGNDTYFQLQPRLTDEEHFTADETQLTTILNTIMGVEVEGQKWASYGVNCKDATLSATMNIQEKELGDAFNAFTTIPESEARAGSGSAVLRTVYDLWTKVNRVVASATDAEATAKAVATAIVTALDTYFNYDTDNQCCTFDETYSGLSSFPVNYHLPAGAAQLTLDHTGRFAYKSSVGLGASAAVSSIMWPSELCYFGNGPLRTSDAMKAKDNLPATVDDWQDDDNENWDDFEKNSRVQASTSTVAMQNAINYGTALLATSVRYGESLLKDNNSSFHPGNQDNSFDVATNSPFTFKGILIGGQYNKIGWNYLPTSNAVATSVIYDDAITDEGSIPVYSTGTNTSAPNYTLVFDNYVTGTQKDVMVCLEFVNNSGRDFYGDHNLIGKGETFYLIGKLKPSEGIGDPTFPNQSDDANPSHPLPPYDANGYTQKVKRVFIQDYMTTAVFSLVENSLKHAFATVPDLRTAEMSLGLGVDVEWSTGPVYSGMRLGE